jgi:hypothetical protein
MSAAAPADRRLFARPKPTFQATRMMCPPTLHKRTATGGTRAKSAGINTAPADRRAWRVAIRNAMHDNRVKSAG